MIPVIYKDVDTEAILEACRKTVLTLKKAGFRVKADLSTTSTPGQKYWHWEMKGVPLRIEIGQRDLDKNQVRLFLQLTLPFFYIISQCVIIRVMFLLMVL